MYLTLILGELCWSLFWYALFCVLSSSATIMTRKRELVAVILLSFGCLDVALPQGAVAWSAA